MKALLIILGSIVGVILLGFLALSLTIGIGMKRATEPKVSIESYEEIFTERAENSDRYSFLPIEIPADAEKVAFYHAPGFLQGGDIICLRIKLPKSRIESLLAALEKTGRTEVDSAEILKFAHYCYPAFGIEKASGDKMFEHVSTLPSGFRVFLHKSSLEDIEENWNHNFLAFTAISLNNSEIVYHVNNW
jgi:hypothetical protein